MTINISNFSISEDTYVLKGISYFITVDLLDFSYNANSQLDLNNSYFSVNNVRLPTTFAPLSNGYRMQCNTTSISGNCILQAKAVTVSGIYKKNFKLETGFKLTYNSVVDWGVNNVVEVYAEAYNTENCPSIGTFASFFKTRDLFSRDLHASIYTVPPVDLAACIQPHGPYLDYGKTYTITISGIKDLDGNKVESTTFTFTVEQE